MSLTAKDKRYIRSMSRWLLMTMVRVWLNQLATRKDIEPMAVLLLEELFERYRQGGPTEVGPLPGGEPGGEGGKAQAE